MDDPGEWAEPWPYWKFGLKQNDLHESLHTKYNTITSSIQDPEAFHHDVYELSTRADTLSEFEQLMEERKAQRLKELNLMLEDASFQIVGCPRLIGTDQWPLAVQLFRTRSLDSLVRYFASYLPNQHPWYRDSDSGGSGASSPISPVDYADYDGPILFDEPEEDETFYTNEPSEPFSTCATAVDLADSNDQPARSNTLHSVDSGVSVTGRKQRELGRDSQTMSVSGLESDSMATSLIGSVPTLHDDEAISQSDYSETPSTSIDDVSDGGEEARGKDAIMTTVVDEEDADVFRRIAPTPIMLITTIPHTYLLENMRTLDSCGGGMIALNQNDQSVLREDGQQAVGGMYLLRAYVLEHELEDVALVLDPAVINFGVPWWRRTAPLAMHDW